MIPGKKCYDHLGNEYRSERAMCAAHKIDSCTYRDRIKSGMTVEQALTRKTRNCPNLEKLIKQENGCYFDHLKNPFCSIRNMCKCWHVVPDTFYNRINNGFSLKYTLTHNNPITTPDVDKDIIWVFGAPYATYTDVDKAFGFCGRVSHKHSDDLEGWLTKEGRYYIDDKIFCSTAELAEAYGKTEACIYNRINLYGWSLDDAVHKPVKETNRGMPCKDHLGNDYISKSAMTAAYHISNNIFHSRIKNGWSLKDALTVPVKRHSKVVV